MQYTKCKTIFQNIMLKRDTSEKGTKKFGEIDTSVLHISSTPEIEL